MQACAFAHCDDVAARTEDRARVDGDPTTCDGEMKREVQGVNTRLGCDRQPRVRPASRTAVPQMRTDEARRNRPSSPL